MGEKQTCLAESSERNHLKPRVSIITSTYKRPELLKRAVDSIIAQTYTDWELIIVHDGPFPAGETILPKQYLKDARIILLATKEHTGFDCHPKNIGIQQSRGELIALCDDDNTWRPDHLQALVVALDQAPDITMVYGDRFVHNEDKSRPDGLGIFAEYAPARVLRRNFIDTSDVLVRKEALLYVGGFDERYRKFVDWNLWVRLDKAGYRFKRVPLILTDYYLHKDSKGFRPEDTKPDGSPAWEPSEVEIRLPFTGSVSPARVAVFSLTYDRLDYSKTCFASLYKTAGYPFDHYIVDNGSTDGTVEWLKELSGTDRIVIFNPDNKGISKASNQALEAIGDRYDIIVKVDNDCLFKTEGWLRRMVDIWERNHRIALSPYVEGLRDNPGGAQREGHGTIRGELLGLARHLGGICVFASQKAYATFRWDEEMPLHGVQDVEFSQYLLRSGYQMAYLENYICEHYEGTQGQEKRYPAYFARRVQEKSQRYAENQQS